MDTNTFDEIVRRSLEIRKQYHILEKQHHGELWSVEEDALAFLTDAGLVGRDIMAQQKRWPKSESELELEHKLAENIWWLIVLADRTGIDINEAIDKFLSKTEKLLK